MSDEAKLRKAALRLADAYKKFIEANLAYNVLLDAPEEFVKIRWTPRLRGK